jgi:hypothetical protein
VVALSCYIRLAPRIAPILLILFIVDLIIQLAYHPLDTDTFPFLFHAV